ncbi:MAG: ferritin-like domain-containing protein [Burkholderiaceae bacterium]|nr:ferritin-like domain-containing protein [Burkholderiaceae bacterium]
METPSEVRPDVARPKRAHWHIDDIAYGAIDPSRVFGDEALFHMVASASFIETGSDTYTHNLVAHFADYPEMASWLSAHWEPEDLQHGAALARYAQTVWPRFPWRAAYESFFAEYSRLCTMEALQAGALEMVARCVVEMGTSTYYQLLRTLAERAGEPVLADLANRIRVDEVGHYKQFLTDFKTLKGQHPVSRWDVMRVLWARLRELRESDSDVALRHVWTHAHAADVDLFPDGSHTFEELSGRLFHLLSQNLPLEQATRMTLRPLMLPHRIENWLQTPAVWLGRRQW